MEKRYLGQDVHELILGEKLNGFKSPKSNKEYEHLIKIAKEWINKNPDKHINFY
jgi:hypothetical protein